MNNSLLFLSDFDGTISKKEFYEFFVERGLEELNKDCINRVIRGEITSFEYLDLILSSVNLSKEEIDEIINSMKLSNGFIDLYKYIKNNGGDFAVVSAGSSYYIQPILDNLQLEYELFSNGGYFTNNGIKMEYPEDKYRESFYGIDKGAVALALKEKYNTIIFAGDGSSDIAAAKHADIVFAKSTLAYKLSKTRIKFYHFEDFDDILNILNSEFSQLFLDSTK